MRRSPRTVFEHGADTSGWGARFEPSQPGPDRRHRSPGRRVGTHNRTPAARRERHDAIRRRPGSPRPGWRVAPVPPESSGASGGGLQGCPRRVWHFIAGSPSGAGDAELAGADGASATALQPPPHLLTTLPAPAGGGRCRPPRRSGRAAECARSPCSASGDASAASERR